ncbi:MAG: type I 3-dehydroquinate dehydratase [Vicinamibacterales bacterium]
MTDVRTALICETVTGRSMADLVAARDASRADMVELRLDGIDRPDVAQALAGRRTPVIVTCRPAWEGGRFDGSEEARKAILRSALEGGAEYVDVEWRAGFQDLIDAGAARSVVSSHDFSGVPADLVERVRAMRQTGAAVVKVAVTPSRLSDTLPLLAIGREGGAVVIGMGEAGVPTRLLAARFGSPWSYAGNAVAPGQVPAARMAGEFRFRSVGPQTEVYGVVGNNVMHSLSPAMHNAAFAAAGIDAVYVPFHPADFDDFLTFADAIGVAGASVTIPFKLDALRAAASADELTVAVGAANTLRRLPPEGGSHTWEALNTDVDGFLDPLERAYGQSLRGARVSILGAGGSARAVIVALVSRGARVTVHARREAPAQAVAASLGAAAGAWPPAAESWDVLVNCTPLGGANARDVSPLPGGPFTGRLVDDLTYGPGESALLREARAAGCAVLDGLPMLVAQAERQFEWWTGMRPASGVMAAAAQARVA